jgi:hypothetical protein
MINDEGGKNALHVGGNGDAKHEICVCVTVVINSVCRCWFVDYNYHRSFFFDLLKYIKFIQKKMEMKIELCH